MPSADARLEPRAGIPLAPLTTLGVGGRAEWFVPAATAGEVAAAHRWCAARQVPLFVLGGGSNLVIADEGVRGLVVQMAIAEISFTPDGDDTVIRAGAGAPWDALVAETVSRGLAGLECLSGIPGTVGGTPVQNVGAYGQEVATTIEALTVFDRFRDDAATLAAADCAFGYRTSRFKRGDAGRYVVCDVTFRLRAGSPTVAYPDVIKELERRRVARPALQDVRDAVLAIRRGKGMVIDPSDPDTRSVGSFFTNPIVSPEVHARIAGAADARVPGFPSGDGQVKMSAAWLIERSGFSRGYQAGRVGLSSRHPLAIVNRGGATARDVLDLAVRIKRRVVECFGVSLLPEPACVGFAADDPDVAYLYGRVG